MTQTPTDAELMKHAVAEAVGFIAAVNGFLNDPVVGTEEDCKRVRRGLIQHGQSVIKKLSPLLAAAPTPPQPLNCRKCQGKINSDGYGLAETLSHCPEDECPVRWAMSPPVDATPPQPGGYDPELLERAENYASKSDEIYIKFFKNSELQYIIQRPIAHFVGLLRRRTSASGDEVERVARAIANVDCDDGATWCVGSREHCKCMKLARAAVAAMRPPEAATQGMVTLRAALDDWFGRTDIENLSSTELTDLLLASGIVRAVPTQDEWAKWLAKYKGADRWENLPVEVTDHYAKEADALLAFLKGIRVG